MQSCLNTRLHLHSHTKRGAILTKEKFKKVSYDAIKKNKTLSLFVPDETEIKPVNELN